MKQMIETKRHYQRPEMKVVELRQKCCILTVSGGDSKATMTVTYDEEDI